uniref:Uncharacterized protein n=1 Tax=Panagrolaimus davidi TaxID=227884 RepID=A0A914PR89_9BILA
MGINTYAKMDQHESVRLHDHEHVCTKLQYSPEKYFELQIIKKPNYEILENCNTKSGKILIIFKPIDRTQCHEFPWQNYGKAFRCKECHASVKISNASKENEYIEILILNHECPFRQFDREKYFKFKNCKKCFKQKIIVSAKLYENSDGENYVILSNKEHVCESVKYIPFNNDIILRSPNIKVMKETSNGVGKMLSLQEYCQ